MRFFSLFDSIKEVLGVGEAVLGNIDAESHFFVDKVNSLVGLGKVGNAIDLLLSDRVLGGSLSTLEEPSQKTTFILEQAQAKYKPSTTRTSR